MVKCYNCGLEEATLDHHVSYGRDETVPLCRDCHYEVHGDREHPYFPKDSRKDWRKEIPNAPHLDVRSRDGTVLERVPIPWKVLEEMRENGERKVITTRNGAYPITPEIAEEMMEVRSYKIYPVPV